MSEPVQDPESKGHRGLGVTMSVTGTRTKGCPSTDVGQLFRWATLR